MAFANRDAALPVAAINITPLVDVLLVLARSIDVRLPQYTPRPPEPALQLQLRVDAAGGYWLDNTSIDEGALVGTLRSAASRHPGLQLVLRSDDDGDYQGFVSALSAAREAGIQSIATPR